MWFWICWWQIPYMATPFPNSEANRKNRTQKSIDMSMKWWGRRPKMRLYQASQALNIGHWGRKNRNRTWNGSWTRMLRKQLGGDQTEVDLLQANPAYATDRHLPEKYNLRCCGLSLFHGEVKGDRKAWGVAIRNKLVILNQRLWALFLQFLCLRDWIGHDTPILSVSSWVTFHIWNIDRAAKVDSMAGSNLDIWDRNF